MMGDRGAGGFPFTLLIRSAMFMGLIFFFITSLIDVFIPLAQGRKLVVYEPNGVIAFFECIMIVVIIAFLIQEYVRIVSHEAKAQKT